VSTPGKPDPARGWLHVENLLAEDELARIEKLTPEQVEEELRAEGTLVPSAAELMAGVERKAREREAAAVRATRKRRSPLRTVSIIAAVLAAFLLIVFAYKNRAAIEAYFKGEPIRPDDQWLPWRPSPTPQERAAKMRQDAFAACEQVMYETCGRKLDEARELDPAGEADPRVMAARQDIEAELGDGGTEAGKKKDKAPRGP
jgi:hypothetical protein